MNDQDRDRSGDGAGPVAPDEGGPSRRSLRLTLARCGLALTLLTSAFAISALHAQEVHQRGLSLSLGAGALLSDNVTANFYSGCEGNVNTTLRILHSQAYGPQIWTSLTEQDLISSAIGSYRELQIAEYGDMYYRMAIQLSLGFRYDYDNGWGWLTRFDYARLGVVGSFLISATNGTGILTNMDQYVRCGVGGDEKRVLIDLGLSKQFRLRNGMDISFELGGSALNTSVLANDIEVAGVTYNILDIWDGQSPSAYTAAYSYIDQGGIGFGGFGGVAVGYTLPNHNALKLTYCFHYVRVELEGYENYSPMHFVGIRMDMGNFSFLNGIQS